MENHNERLIAASNDEVVVEFTPTIFRLLPEDCCGLEKEPHIHLRFFYRFMVGYKMYILKKNGTAVAYAMVQWGKIRRYPYVGRRDLMLGPIFVNPEYRGMGLVGKVIRGALSTMKATGRYDAVYAWIVESNHSSQKAVSKVGFYKHAWLDASGFIKKPVDHPTNYGLWKLDLTKFSDESVL